MASRNALLGALLAVGSLLLLSAPAARAQIVREKPGQIKAANRRALRDARRTDAPYKDTHLDVTASQLKRGQSAPPQPKTDNARQYKKGAAPNVKPLGFMGLRRNKTSTLVRKEQRQKPRNAEKK